MYISKTNSELRRDARTQLKGRWGKPILVMVIYIAIAAATAQIPYIGYVAPYIIGGPLLYGTISFFLKLKRGEEAALDNILDGFKNFVPTFVLYLVYNIFILLWSLLFIIPGIIKSLSYSQTFYILNDNPQMKALDAITLSRKMMDGYKGKYFLLQLSFIGWGLLGILTIGIGWLWLAPYCMAANANFYDDVRKAYDGGQGGSYESNHPIFREN